MKIACMQPYAFAYLGYYQLVHAVDNFVLLDDVNYIKRGWSNRNRILLNGQEHRFTIPVKKASQNKLYNEIELTDQWRTQLDAVIYHAYGRTMPPTFSLCNNIVDLAAECIKFFVPDSTLQLSSLIDYGGGTGQQRILNICKALSATEYINPPGGREVYDSALFESNGIELKFLQPIFKPYPQKSTEFVSGLSIIDVYLNDADMKEQLESYEITR